MHLLSNNTKIEKSNAGSSKYFAAILQLAPYNLSGYNVCPEASPACSSQCLYYAGFGRYQNVQDVRIERTKMFFEARTYFLKLLKKDVESVIKRANKLGLKPAVRLNGMSDLPWEKFCPELFDYPVQFWDYTKIRTRYRSFLNGELPKNYHLTFSRSEKNEEAAIDFLNIGGNVAVVGTKRPRYWNGFITVDGDKSDFRFLDKENRVVWLIPKGRAKKDTSGFVLGLAA